MNPNTIISGDCLAVLASMDTDSIDLVVTSPPYEDARPYGEIDFRLCGDDWLDWALPRFVECVRVSRGPVCWVVAGRTRGYRYSAVPERLMARLHDAGVCLRRPVLYRRTGIPGSGGRDWFASRWEYVICATSGGRLPWSDNTACGHPPKYPAGGAVSYQTRTGRVEAERRRKVMPKLANPGDIIDAVVGGGHLGSKLAHENEAPFPEAIPERFIRSFCPPGGVVLDPFVGSGTTLAVAERLGRRWIGIDVRESQAELARRRVEEVRGKDQASGEAGDERRGDEEPGEARVCGEPPTRKGPGEGRPQSGDQAV